MVTNWISHTFSETPRILKAENMFTVSDESVRGFHERVRLICLLRTELPESLETSLCSAEASEYCSILQSGVAENDIHDMDAVSDYCHAVDMISRTSGGFLRICRSRIRQLRACATELQEKQPLLPDGNNQSPRPSTQFVWIPSHFNSFGLPQEVRDRVYPLLLCQGDLCITDWHHKKRLDTVRLRTEYELHIRGRRTGMNYMVRPGMRLDVDIMGVNRQTCAEASAIFYGENRFRFIGTCDAALSFLHDRANQLATLRKV